jgi:hypothetical protein
MKPKNLLIIGGLLVVGYVVYKKMSNSKAEAQKKAEDEKPKEVTIKSDSGEIGSTPSIKSAPIDDIPKDLKLSSSMVRKMASSRFKGMTI